MAVTVSISATKIDVTNTGGVQVTLEEVYQAVELHTPGTMTKTANGGNWVYRITAASYRELEISNNCKVLFEVNDVLEWEWGTTSGTYWIFDIATGSEVEVEEGFRFDLGVTGTYRRGYISIYGKMIMLGTEANPIIIEHCRSTYAYFRADQYWRHVIFQDPTYSSGYMLYYSNYTAYYVGGIDLDIKHITFRNTDPAHNSWGRVYFTTFGFPETEWLIDTWTMDSIGYLYLYGSTLKFKDCVFRKIYVPIYLYGAGNNVGLPYESSKDDTKRPRKSFQPKVVFDDCVFEDLYRGNYSVYVYYGSTVLFKNCFFRGVLYSGTQDGIYIAYYGNVFLYNPTYEGIQPGREIVQHSTSGPVFHVREVAIRVVDQEGNPIEKAVVGLRQSENREWHVSHTDANGDLKNVYGDDPVLIEKEETAVGVYDDWSDSIEDGRYHIITVSKEGYGLFTQAVEVTEDLDIEITLAPFMGVGAALTGAVKAAEVVGAVTGAEVTGEVEAININDEAVVVEITGEVIPAEIEGNI